MMTNQKKKELMVKCPQCRKKFNYYSISFRPFCSERCKMVDMGHWLEESYSIKGKDGEAINEVPWNEEGNDEEDH